MDIVLQITSKKFALRAGMMPSHDASTIAHSSFMARQTAFMRSIYQPSHWTDAYCDATGGYGSAATPKRIDAWPCGRETVMNAASRARQYSKPLRVDFIKEPQHPNDLSEARPDIWVMQIFRGCLETARAVSADIVRVLDA